MGKLTSAYCELSAIYNFDADVIIPELAPDDGDVGIFRQYMHALLVI